MRSRVHEGRFVQLRERLRARASFFDAPGVYRAGIDDALDAVEVLLAAGQRPASRPGGTGGGPPARSRPGRAEVTDHGGDSGEG